MNKDQRLKLAQALITEAVVTPDTEEARHLSELAVRHEFKDEIEKLMKGDVELFKKLSPDKTNLKTLRKT